MPRDFMGQVSANLYDASRLTFQPDEIISPLLLNVWKKEFAETNSSEWKRLALFRSLEMAYQATSLPSNSRYTMYDFGPRIALWVSAFEVLIHPGRKKPNKKREQANIEKVTKLLKEASWCDARLRRRAYLIWIERGKTERVNLILKLYRELYDARNDFLHGNRVVHSRLFCFRNERRRSLIEIAPVLYKVALSCFFRKIGDRCAIENALLATLVDRK